MHRPRAAAPRARVVFVLMASLAVATGAGCDQLSARSMVQKGNALYEEQEYEKAIVKYEAALKKTPDLTLIHHNLGIAYARLFRPGLDTPENKALATKASEHLQLWLAKKPGDKPVRKYLLDLWIKAGDYQSALDYYLGEHKANPTNREYVSKIASIYMLKSDWRTAVEWLQKDVELAPDAPAKVAAYNVIANVAFGKLWSAKARLDVRGLERTEIAEVGLKAAEAGLALDDKHMPLTSVSQGLWNNHALAQGPFWAATIDRAASQVFEQRGRVLREEAKKNQPPQPAGTPPGTGS